MMDMLVREQLKCEVLSQCAFPGILSFFRIHPYEDKNLGEASVCSQL